MKLLALCHLFCCRACWLLYFISCNQGCFCLPRVIYRVGEKIAMCSLASKASFKLSKWATASLPHSDILLFDPRLYKNKSTFLDFIFLETWKQFPCQRGFHWEITWFSAVRIVHSHGSRQAAPPCATLSAQKWLLWGSPSPVPLGCTCRAEKLLVMGTLFLSSLSCRDEEAAKAFGMRDD